MSLRVNLLKLASSNPKIRPHLRKILQSNRSKIAVDVKDFKDWQQVIDLTKELQEWANRISGSLYALASRPSQVPGIQNKKTSVTALVQASSTFDGLQRIVGNDILNMEAYYQRTIDNIRTMLSYHKKLKLELENLEQPLKDAQENVKNCALKGDLSIEDVKKELAKLAELKKLLK